MGNWPDPSLAYFAFSTTSRTFPRLFRKRRNLSNKNHEIFNNPRGSLHDTLRIPIVRFDGPSNLDRFRNGHLYFCTFCYSIVVLSLTNLGPILMFDACCSAPWTDALISLRALSERSELARSPSGVCPIFICRTRCHWFWVLLPKQKGLGRRAANRQYQRTAWTI